MTINERVSDERIANLIEVLSFYSPEDKRLANNESDLASALRELQQYRAATACPAVWVRYGDANHAPDCTLDNDEAREWVARGLDVVRMVSPINAAPQVTSVPDEMTYEQAREITSKKSFLVDRDSPASLFASGYNACRMDVYLAAPAVQAEQLSGNTEQVTKCWCHACRPVTMADMRFVVCPECGNKRCPHANDHRNACTGSNEPGQEGSAYPAAPQKEAE